jgi:hypothetical protein
MPAIRSKEFAEFAKHGGTKTFGSLKFKGDEVYSYAMLIARVDRANKVVQFDNEGRSVTTSRHQHAVSRGFSSWLEKEGWKLKIQSPI